MVYEPIEPPAIQPSGANGPEVYLCQISPQVSCGACCGLYNVADPSPEHIEAMLVRRTRWFAMVPRTVAGIDAFKARVEDSEPGERPFPDFHHCAFLGLIEDQGRRVGCLLHPLAIGNDGLDWRGVSYYGGMACRTYFCPSVRQLPARWLAALRSSMDHWYLHGLIVTERQLLTAFFRELERRIGRKIDASDFSSSRQASRCLREFTRLKIDWPFRRRNAPGVCNYFFEDGRYPRPQWKAATDNVDHSPFDAIFRELDSGFPSPADRKRAHQILADLWERMAQALLE